MSNDLERPEDVRARLQRALEGADLHRAIQFARRALSESSGARGLSSLRSLIDKADKHRLGLKPLKLALLSSFSIEFVHDAVICQGFLEGLDVQIYQSGFGQYRQEILAGASGLQAFEPDITVLAVEGEHWIAQVYGAPMEAGDPELDAAVESGLAEMEQLTTAFAERVGGLLLVHNLDAPRRPALGILDGKTGLGQMERVLRFNLGVQALARRLPDLHVVDYAGLVAETGRDRWYDARMAHYAKAPVSAMGLQRLAGLYARFMRARAGRTRKCLVLDLDNTLWGGVVGEDGLQGIKLGPNYPGSAFMEFQRAVADLSRRGVLLAVASKNNPDDAWEVFDRHPNMVLRKQDFVASRVNWDPKSESIRSIAEELNLGLEHFVFVDDNPAECEQVREALPMVTVIELPRAPEAYQEALLRDGLFDSLSFSEEDRRRGELYRQRSHAQTLMHGVDSLESYYRQLEMRVSIERLNEANVTRAAQMTQKTNQFNVTTRRYTEGDLRVIAASADWVALTVQVQDRFGDHGIVGLMLAREHEGALDIDTLLLSCRVIGRTVESAMLSVLCDEAAGRGLGSIAGRLIPTPKNPPVRDLYRRHGFACVSGNEESESEWRIDLRNGERVACPEWLRLETTSMA